MDNLHSPELDPLDLSRQQTRQHWMAVLANASETSIEKALPPYNTLPSYHYLRAPEIGLAMVRGRAGGTGEPFNLGEITLTRCVVQLDETVGDRTMSGFGDVAGRSQRHAELAAMCDALLQHPTWRQMIYQQVVTPLAIAAQQRQAKENHQTDATKVNFLTMLRGEVS